MNGFYCKIGLEWFYREDSRADNWFGPFLSRKAAVKERMDKRLSVLKNRQVVVITKGRR